MQLVLWLLDVTILGHPVDLLTATEWNYNPLRGDSLLPLVLAFPVCVQQIYCRRYRHLVDRTQRCYGACAYDDAQTSFHRHITTAQERALLRRQISEHRRQTCNWNVAANGTGTPPTTTYSSARQTRDANVDDRKYSRVW